MKFSVCTRQNAESAEHTCFAGRKERPHNHAKLPHSTHLIKVTTQRRGHHRAMDASGTMPYRERQRRRTMKKASEIAPTLRVAPAILFFLSLASASVAFGQIDAQSTAPKIKWQPVIENTSVDVDEV